MEPGRWYDFLHFIDNGIATWRISGIINPRSRTTLKMNYKIFILDNLSCIKYNILSFLFFYLMCITLPSDDICDKLIPPTSQNVQNGYCSNTKCLSMSYGIFIVRQVDNHDSRYYFSYGKEQLVIPLGVKIIVPIIYVHPPRVIMWK